MAGRCWHLFRLGFLWPPVRPDASVMQANLSAFTQLTVRIERAQAAGLLPHRAPVELALELAAVANGLAASELYGMPPDVADLAAGFGRAVHDAGVPCSPERSVRFAQALACTRPRSRARLYWTARCVFVVAVLGRDPAVSGVAVDELRCDVERMISEARADVTGSRPPPPTGSGG